jgi:uroporphyrinogen decarboxylase
MGATVIKHTDGNTLPLLDMIVETGIDGLHGIQPSIGMDLKLLKSRYGEKIVLFGAEEAKTLINETPQDAIDEVERCIRAAAPGGGYVLTTSNSVQAGSRVENYLAMLTHARSIGTYPILQ